MEKYAQRKILFRDTKGSLAICRIGVMTIEHYEPVQ
jgi:hypothetical protein